VVSQSGLIFQEKSTVGAIESLIPRDHESLSEHAVDEQPPIRQFLLSSNSKMVFSTLALTKFNDVKLFRASDTRGKKWNEYGTGTVQANIITGSDLDGPNREGCGQVTFHNDLTRACGLNCLVVPNFEVSPSSDEPDRVTFKALSRTIGNNGKKNMYSIRLASAEDAQSFCCIVDLLQRAAAKQAKDGNAISIPDQHSIEVVVARFLIGTDKKEIERFLIYSQLIELVRARVEEHSSISDEATETSSLPSPNFTESQDWFAAFQPP